MYLDDCLTEDELREAVQAHHRAPFEAYLVQETKLVELPETDRKNILDALDKVDVPDQLGACKPVDQDTP